MGNSGKNSHGAAAWLEASSKTIFFLGGDDSHSFSSVSIGSISDSENATALTFAVLTPASKPSPRRSAAVWTDGKVAFVFGGVNATAHNDLWMFNSTGYAMEFAAVSFSLP